MATERRTADPLPVLPASRVGGCTQSFAWLVEGLWAARGVGVVGGAPKSCKTWLALDLAVSVASGTPALGFFAVPDPGPVLLYGAEDHPAHLRDRIEAIATARGVGMDGLDLGLISVPSLRLDTERDVARLRRTVEIHGPRLLVLDPLVRLHRADENSAGEMSALLGELRALEREHRLAIVLVHHLRKHAGADGQALRGSGDLHAWGDSNLYLRRREARVRLVVEHRSAPAPSPCELELTLEPAPHLRVLDDDGSDPLAPADLAERVLAHLVDAGRPVSRDGLREALRARNASLGDVLVRLRHEGRIERCDGGFRVRQAAPENSHSRP